VLLVGSLLLVGCSSSEDVHRTPTPRVEQSSKTPDTPTPTPTKHKRKHRHIGLLPLIPDTDAPGLRKRDMQKPLQPIGGDYDLASTAMTGAESGDFRGADDEVQSITNPRLQARVHRGVQLLIAADILERVSLDSDSVTASEVEDLTDPDLRERLHPVRSCHEKTTTIIDPTPYKYEYFYGYDLLTRKYDYHYGSHYHPDPPRSVTTNVCQWETSVALDGPALRSEAEKLEKNIERHTSQYYDEYQHAQ